MSVKLSKTSKLDGILSWSLEALDTCQGSIGANGELVPACQGCYATTGNYRFSNVKAPRQFNKKDWQRDEWVSDMLIALDSSRYFRFFDSGDIYSVKLAEKILELCTKATWCKFWIPTRMYKFAKYHSIFARLEALPNVVLRYSSDSVTGEIIQGNNTSTIFSNELPTGAFECKAYENAGKCNGCRACYDKNVSVVAYKAHGVKMAKVIKILSVKG
jgi:hypothetical protein